MVLLASMQAGAQPPNSVVFSNVSVVPMTGNQVLPNHTVVITGDRITAVGPARTAKVPEGATRIDGQGKYLMPGLAEMHGHIPGGNAPREFVDNVLFLYVASGVTTVRGMQGAPGQIDLREAAKRGELLARSPRGQRGGQSGGRRGRRAQAISSMLRHSRRSARR
jgi:imidazolonepropionase-like amidohydrolase